MTYNVFDGTLSLTQSIIQPSLQYMLLVSNLAGDSLCNEEVKACRQDSKASYNSVFDHWSW